MIGLPCIPPPENVNDRLFSDLLCDKDILAVFRHMRLSKAQTRLCECTV